VPQNAFFAMRNNFDPVSNLTDESHLHPRKQLSHKIITDAGIETDRRIVFEDTFDSISFN
jgi:hypothetical protein